MTAATCATILEQLQTTTLFSSAASTKDASVNFRVASEDSDAQNRGTNSDSTKNFAIHGIDLQR